MLSTQHYDEIPLFSTYCKFNAPMFQHAICKVQYYDGTEESAIYLSGMKEGSFRRSS